MKFQIEAPQRNLPNLHRRRVRGQMRTPRSAFQLRPGRIWTAFSVASRWKGASFRFGELVHGPAVAAVGVDVAGDVLEPRTESRHKGRGSVAGRGLVERVYRLGECGISSQSSSNQSLARSSNNPAVSTAARTRLTLQTGVFPRWLARAAVLAWNPVREHLDDPRARPPRPPAADEGAGQAGPPHGVRGGGAGRTLVTSGESVTGVSVTIGGR